MWVSPRTVPDADKAEAARVVEAAGYGTYWQGGSPSVQDLRPLLEASERLVVASGILNVWQHDPADVGRDFLALAEDFPGRVLLGVGVGHPEATSDYRRPLRAMRAFLDGLAGAGVPRELMVAAALGPRMLDLAGERTLGTHPYFTTPAHTRLARERLGPEALVAPELTCVVDTDVERARAKARRFAKLYLGLVNYTSNLLRTTGFTEADIAGGGSDRLIDAVVAHGSPEDIAAAAQAHFDAGADHVCLQPVGTDGMPREEWATLAR